MQLDRVSQRTASKRARGDDEVAPLIPRPEFSAVSVWQVEDDDKQAKRATTVREVLGDAKARRHWPPR